MGWKSPHQVHMGYLFGWRGSNCTGGMGALIITLHGLLNAQQCSTARTSRSKGYCEQTAISLST